MTNWTETEVALLTDLAFCGMLSEKIAIKMKKPIDEVMKMRKILGVTVADVGRCIENNRTLFDFMSEVMPKWTSGA